ncbi:MAG: ferritin family protein [Candidatus Omnitrophota bacterium]
MGNIFSGSEIVELGIQIEKNGQDFYSALADKTNEEKGRQLFRYLALEEEKHITVFKGILAGLGAYEPQGLDADEYFAYMKELASGCIFTVKDKGKEIASKVQNEDEAIGLGIGFEKDSIVFYEGMKKAVPEYDHKVLDELIAQEQEHLRQLQGLKGML